MSFVTPQQAIRAPRTLSVLKTGTELSASSSAPTLSAPIDMAGVSEWDVELAIGTRASITEVTMLFFRSSTRYGVYVPVLDPTDAVYSVAVTVSAPTTIGAHMLAQGAFMKVGFYASVGSPTGSAAGAVVTVY